MITPREIEANNRQDENISEFVQNILVTYIL